LVALATAAVDPAVLEPEDEPEPEPQPAPTVARRATERNGSRRLMLPHDAAREIFLPG
jgi:hypothetical protein